MSVSPSNLTVAFNLQQLGDGKKYTVALELQGTGHKMDIAGINVEDDALLGNKIGGGSPSVLTMLIGDLFTLAQVADVPALPVTFFTSCESRAPLKVSGSYYYRGKPGTVQP